MRVRYAETDRMGIAYNAHYLTWFEVGRTEAMRDLGLPYREVEERGLHLPLVEVGLTLRRPALYDELIEIETRISETRSRTVTFAYRILRGEEVLAEGFTRHACVRAASGRTVSIPDWLSTRL